MTPEKGKYYWVRIHSCLDFVERSKCLQVTERGGVFDSTYGNRELAYHQIVAEVDASAKKPTLWQRLFT